MNINKIDFYNVMKAKTAVLYSDKNMLDGIWEELELLSGKKKKFKITNIDGTTETVAGIEINDLFFMFKAPGKFISVSHTKTGARICLVRTMTIGKAIAEKLSGLDCWGFETLKESEKIDPKTKDKILNIITEHITL